MAWLLSKIYSPTVDDKDTCNVSPDTYVLEPDVRAVPDLCTTTVLAVDDMAA